MQVGESNDENSRSSGSRK